MNNLISASALSKHYGHFTAINNISFDIKKGQIVGLIGPNGAGKTSLLKALLGLSNYKGDLSVCNLAPRRNRKQLMQHVCFIADVAILPRWLKVSQALDFVEGVHPKFNRTKAESFLKKTDIKHTQKVRQLSKGMTVQLHLALIMAIDVELLVLDEPTLGLDILYRKQFYQSLLNDYFNQNRTIVITTHQIEEVEHILTRIMMLNKGNLIVDSDMEQLQHQFKQLITKPEHEAVCDSLKPIAKNKRLGELVYLFEDTDNSVLEQYGTISTAAVSDIFTAKVLGENQ